MSGGGEDPKAAASAHAHSDTADATRHDRPSRPSLQQPSAPAPDFGSRYRVIGPVGKGGMGEVFRAFDGELKVDVALKIVRSDTEHDEALARFRREIALARKVSSPNVLRVYDLAEHAGLRFLSMEYVDGEDLASLMRREKQLNLARALAIFRQVCVGLAAAHLEGVVHRDLKPQNVLVGKDDRVRVADFGLARSLGDSGMTKSGTQLGSPAYMSPEQVTGEPANERSDVYSLGIMLYQLVAGQTPFQADTPHAVMEMRLHKRPKPLRELMPDVPPYLDAIVARCLEVAPDRRYASMGDLLADLDAGRAEPARRRRWRWPVWVGGSALVLAGLAGAWIATHHHEPASTPPPTSPTTPATVATAPAPLSGQSKVLVFGIDNRTADPTFDVADTILEFALRRSRRLDPVAGTYLKSLAAELAPDPLPLDEHLGRALAERVHHRVIVVRSSVVAKGRGVTFSIAATDVTTGERVLERTREAESQARVVPTLGRLAADLRDALGDQVPDADAEQTGLSPSLAADREFVQGWQLHAAGDDPGAVPHYRQAVVADPEFALAHADLGVAASNGGMQHEAKVEFERAFALAGHMGDRDHLLFEGLYFEIATGELDRAIDAFRGVLDLWPDDFTAQVDLAILYSQRRELKKAVEFAQQAIQIHPRNLRARNNAAAMLIQFGDFAGGLAAVKRIQSEFSRQDDGVYENLGDAEALLGHLEEAHVAYTQLTVLAPSDAPSYLADLDLAEGQLASARERLEQGVAADRASHNDDAIECKHALLSELLIRKGDKARGLAEAAQVVREPDNLFIAAWAQLGAGAISPALSVAAKLEREPAPTPRAYARLLEGEASRLQGRLDDAITKLQDGQRILDLALGHVFLGRVLLDAKRYAEAKAELDRGYERRGELSSSVMSMGLRFIPPVLYYRAKAEQGLGDTAAAERDYAAFLAWQPKAEPDAMVTDARAHVGH